MVVAADDAFEFRPGLQAAHWQVFLGDGPQVFSGRRGRAGEVLAVEVSVGSVAHLLPVYRHSRQAVLHACLPFGLQRLKCLLAKHTEVTLLGALC